eukprot:978863_1
MDPSYNPTADPTRGPTPAPSTSPSMTPTHSPSNDPTISPSTAPSVAPSRVPTREVDQIYDTKIEIEYEVKHLNANNKYFVVENTHRVVHRFEEFIERGYFDEVDLQYTDFWCDIYEINGANVESLNDDTSHTALNVYDLDILNQYPDQGMVLTTRIECDGDDGEIILKRSTTSTFTNAVREWFADFLNNSNIEFSIATPLDTLQEELKFPTDEPADTEDVTAMYLSIAIVTMGAMLSLSALAFKKSGKSKVDNTDWIAPLLISLGIYDFISDVNFAIQIFKNDQIKYTINNILLWL